MEEHVGFPEIDVSFSPHVGPLRKSEPLAVALRLLF